MDLTKEGDIMIPMKDMIDKNLMMTDYVTMETYTTTSQRGNKTF